MNSHFKKGFTLLELIVVLAIISLLTSIVLVSITTARAKGRDAQRISDIRQLRTALQLYLTDNQYYPTSLDVLVPNYIKSISQDPLGAAGSGLCRPNYCYYFSPSSNPSYYHIGVQLEISNPVLNIDRDCSSSNGSVTWACIDGVIFVDSEGKPAGFDGSINALGNNPDYIYDLTP